MALKEKGTFASASSANLKSWFLPGISDGPVLILIKDLWFICTSVAALISIHLVVLRKTNERQNSLLFSFLQLKGYIWDQKMHNTNIFNFAFILFSSMGGWAFFHSFLTFFLIKKMFQSQVMDWVFYCDGFIVPALILPSWLDKLFLSCFSYTLRKEQFQLTSTNLEHCNDWWEKSQLPPEQWSSRGRHGKHQFLSLTSLPETQWSNSCLLMKWDYPAPNYLEEA